MRIKDYLLLSLKVKSNYLNTPLYYEVLAYFTSSRLHYTNHNDKSVSFPTTGHIPFSDDFHRRISS